MPPVVTLTTDFEEREPTAASAKGVLCVRCHGVQIIDLSHDVPRQNVREAALFVAEAVPYFAEGTIHIVAVASVGNPIAVSIAGQYVICPNNGVLTLLADQFEPAEIRAVTNATIIRASRGPVFYCRDVFAPAAGFLASGGAFADLGERVERLARLQLPKPERMGGKVQGEIMHISRFGNLVTNIHHTLLEGTQVREIRVMGFPVGGIARSYTEVELGSPLALYGSAGYLEIAYNGDRADNRLKANIGNVVEVAVMS